VTLSAEAFQTAGIQVETVRRSIPATELDVPGQVEYDPRRVALISPRVAGRLERLSAVEGDRVEAGSTVALLYSADYVTAQSELRQAVRRVEFLAGTADEPGAQALARAARRRLRLLGVDEAEVERIAGGGEPRDYLSITAPFAGTIVEAHALAGAAIVSGQEIFKLADLSVVDVVAAVPERSIPLVAVGQRAVIAIAAYPAMRFQGQVERFRGELDPETRTVRAVIHATNRSGRLRPGMFATVTLSGRAMTEESQGQPVLTMPEQAVVSEGERRFVFVEVADRTFERREVTIASLAPPGSTTPVSSRVIVREGIRDGDRVVVQGAFTLKSELAKAGLGEHGH
jgi:multidrug efflux pump subunit AcrA (membrane-fusion protein)